MTVDDAALRPRLQFGELVPFPARVGVGSVAESVLAMERRLPTPSLRCEPTRELTCVVADDHPIAREAIASVLLRNQITVVGKASTGLEALEIITRTRPRVALVDLYLPGLSGGEMARRLSDDVPETALIVYTGTCPARLAGTLETGARGFLLKESPVAELPRAVRMVASGAVYVDPALAAFLVATTTPGNLGREELKILGLLSDGLTNEAIGRRLFLSTEAVRGRVRKLATKLGAEGRTAAVAKAMRQGLIA